ncbi:MAG TPA: FHA domain-containing protein [Pirellulales bacterium]|nr:FHA domain-containing protein [Pirellulales bacterium]
MRCSLLIKTGKHAGREIPIRGPRYLIGCADDCHLKLKPGQGRQYHCAILWEDDGISLRDYGGGTVVSGVRVVDRRRLVHADRLEFGPLHFELQIEGAPATENDRVPGVGARAPGEAKTVDKLPERVERPVSVASDQADLEYQSLIVAGWSAPADSNLAKPRTESPKASLWPLTAPVEQAEPVAPVDLHEHKDVHSESPMASAWPLTAPVEQAERVAAAEVNDFGTAPSESPGGSSWPISAPSKLSQPAATAELGGHMQSDSPKVVRPWYASTAKSAEPAPVVASGLLRRFFLARKSAFSDQNVGRTISMRDLWAGFVSVFVTLFPSDRLDPNVMFFLGILVGIGLSAAGLAFFSISGR